MVRAWLRLGMVFMALIGIWGCGGGGNAPPPVVQPQDGVEQAKELLNEYAKGAPIGSEAMRFEEIVAEVRKADPKKATILEKGFADIQRTPANRSSKAKELLKQL